MPSPDIWRHADLEPLVRFIQRAIDDGVFQPDPLVPVQIEPCERAVYKARTRYLGSLKSK